MTETRELILHVHGLPGGSVEVQPGDTLVDVRKRITEEWDDEQLPDTEYVFSMNSVRQGTKQEAKRNVFALLEKGARVELLSKKRQPLVNSEEPAAKRQKTNDNSSSQFITPIDLPQKSLPQSSLSVDKPSPIKLEAKLNGAPMATTNATASASLKPVPEKEDSDLDEDDACKKPAAKPSKDATDALLEDALLEDDITVNASDDDLQVVIEVNPHQESDEAHKKSDQVLDQLAALLKQNSDYCSEPRRRELLEEIAELKEKSKPQTVFGVLGNTGVGKSSLLNALLDEAAVLPTSGSRGCTAAVVELVYHSELAKEAEQGKEEGQIPVYLGQVEFIKLGDWHAELKMLVNECSTQEKKIRATKPIDDTSAAHAAWEKIDQVYGSGYMNRYRGYSTASAYRALANNNRVRQLLTSTNPEKKYNCIEVKVGEVQVGSEGAKELLKPFGQMKARTKRIKKKWAQEFRKEINTYVYRNGNGDLPQTWPLIRKVQLRGPWSVLSTGAVLVDLPGVRDANAARAKVAERYLQHCNQIAIVAPIKRAVDDGTAKELLGEQFKRRLLMDGQYGNIFFICTQTDDLEATETMRDHSDVAQREPGRWEKMQGLASDISDLEKKINDKIQEEEDFECRLQDAKKAYKDAIRDWKEAQEEEDDDFDIDDDDDDEKEAKDTKLADLKGVTDANKAALYQAKEDLAKWRNDNQPEIKRLQNKCTRLQRKLKSLCATVRNEYSTTCLQDDFKSGLKDLYRKDDGDGADNDVAQTALPDDFNMDVFCISANDYLKLMKIKATSDGSPNTFSSQRHTQIPQLRSYVHEATARFCKARTKGFVENTNNLLDRMKLLAIGASHATGSIYKMKSAFESEMKNLDPKIQPIANNFKRSLDQKIQQSLASSLQTGAKKGSAAVMSTVQSWGSKNRRSNHDKRPDKNGLCWPTYQAVVRRHGVYNSDSVGPVDFNAELLEPMEKEFSTDWQEVLDLTIQSLLADAEKTIRGLCNNASESLTARFREYGMDDARLGTMVSTAKRSTVTDLNFLFQRMKVFTVTEQRDLSRTLLPAVQTSMEDAYDSALMVSRGDGVFDRMKGAMEITSQHALQGRFDKAKKDLIDGIESIIVRLQNMILSTSDLTNKSMSRVFSMCWDEKSDQSKFMSPEALKRIQECRDALLPIFNKLCDIQGEACKLVGVEREEVELDVMGVETFDQTLQRRFQEAMSSDNTFDLRDFDAEVPALSVKAEKKATA